MNGPIPSGALEQHVAVLGKTGSGKTYTAKGAVEWLLAKKRQVCVIDPTGAWWGLRLTAAGGPSGWQVVIIGGAHGDIPLAERSGAAVARLVTQQRASVVIDTSGLTVGQLTRWFIDFADTLYTTIAEPLHLVIDEAHVFMPQGRVSDVDGGRMLHVGNRLMSGGRSKGIRAMLITQRPAKLHKDALTCADTLVAMRVIAPQDRQAIKDWIDGCGDPKEGKAVLDSLAQLNRGEGWVWFPEKGFLQRCEFPPIKTYDSSATPKHGDKPPPEPTAIDLAEVTASMAEAVKEAEANDPKLLRKRIAELETHLKKGKAQPTEIDPRLTDAVRHKAFSEGREDARRAYEPHLIELGNMADELANSLILKAKAARSVKFGEIPVVTHPAVPNGTIAVVKQARPVDPPTVSMYAPAPGLSKMRRAFLTVLVQRARQGPMTKATLLLHAGYASSGDTSKEFAALAREGLIRAEGGGVVITQAGADAVGHVPALPEGEELRTRTLADLPRMEAALLNVYFSVHPDAPTKGFVLERAGYKSSGDTSTAFARLARRGFIVRSGRDYAASEEFFT